MHIYSVHSYLTESEEIIHSWLTSAVTNVSPRPQGDITGEAHSYKDSEKLNSMNI